jgi:integrase/recombinase XerD
MHSIKKFLLHLGVDWVNEIILPKDPINNIIRIDTEDIIHLIKLFDNSKNYLQIKALIMLGTTSGLRAEELYQLQPSDIDLENRIIYVNHNPKNGQSTKTKRSRISFFTYETQQIISEYLNYFKETTTLIRLFSQTHITHLFKESPLKVKDLRKYFSQTWDRKGGPTSIKKILMGHSLKGDVDLQHYNCQSEEDLKKIYDKVLNHRIEGQKHSLQ